MLKSVSRPDSVGASISLTEHLLSIPTWPKDLSPLRQTSKELENTIKNLEDVLTDHSGTLSFECESFTLSQHLVGCFGSLETKSQIKLLCAIVSGLSKISKGISTKDSLSVTSLECIILLTFAVVSAAERESSASEGSSKKGKKDSLILDWNHLKITISEALKNLTSDNNSSTLRRLYGTQSDLDHLVGVSVKISHLFMENQENCRNSQLKGNCVEILAQCAVTLGYSTGIITIILQDLNYLEHLADFNADLLTVMCKKKEDTSVMDKVLQHLGAIKFTANDSTSAKIVSAFILKLTVANTKGMLRNVTSIADFLDSELYSMRSSMLEVFAILFCHLILHGERSEQAIAQSRSFLSVIEERLRDVNAFVRAKVLHVLSEILSANALPVPDWFRVVDLVSGRIIDKSSNVRRRAIQLLSEFIRRHPFCVDGGELSLPFFEDRLKEIDAMLEKMEPEEVKQSMNPSQESVNNQEEDLNESPQALQTLLLQKRYYTDASVFVKQLDSVLPLLVKLLSSSTKTEVFEVMDFFVDANVYKLHSSKQGIKAMMHLIWERDLSTEDGTKKSIKEHVLQSYKKVYLEVDSRITGKDRIVAIALNLISLVQGASVSELASLEQIVMGFVKKQWIPDGVILALDHFLSTKNSSNIVQQTSSMVLLTMIGSLKPQILSSRVESILKVGLGPAGLSDPLMAEYACMALSHVGCTSVRLPNDNIIFTRLASLIKTVNATPRWLQVTSQALKTIYKLADQPSILAGALIKELSRPLMETVEGGQLRCSSLTKLIFVVGHTASCEVLHLDAIERHWKNGMQKLKSGDRRTSSLSMDGITGTEEDDVSEAVRYVRESELLYGEGSLLSVYGPIIASIVCNNIEYPDRNLQIVSTMSLSKMMCVSSRFCDEHLQLFLTILEKSPDAVIRANMTIAFADLAQSFGRIIDSNITYFFRRLRDEDVGVRRNALMVLTHLTLTGMIKVKGQVGEIAKCILDQDVRVADLARLFFHELGSKDKDNAIYNHIPDIISTLSTSSTCNKEEDGSLSEDDFMKIAKFIFEYVKKEKQMEGLVEKLCQRLRQCHSLRQSRDLAYCLTLINYTSDRTVRRFVEALPLYKDKLVDGKVYRHIVEALQKARKGGKDDMKVVLDEFEQQIIKASGDVDVWKEEDDAMMVDSLESLNLTQSYPSQPQVKGSGGVRRGRPAGRRNQKIEDDEDGEEESEDDIPTPIPRLLKLRPSSEIIKPTKPISRRRAITRVRGSSNPDTDNDDEDIF